ncbi:MAG: hypothetical protein WKF85_05385 [Chitinophagaceae bacterium]
MGFQCGKVPIEYKYNFVEKINLFPTSKSYKVGDTIWLQYLNPNKLLFDNRTSNHIAADTVSLDFQISFNSRYNAPVNPSGGFCDYVSSNGVNVGRYLGDLGTGFLFTFGCNSNNNYNFIVGVVPKHRGIYSLDLLGTPRNVSACSNRSSGFPLSTIEYRFNVADGNKDVYLTIPPHSRGESPKGYTESKIDIKQVYVVKVE